MSVKLGQKTSLSALYITGLLLSGFLSGFSYFKQKQGIEPIQKIIKHYEYSDRVNIVKEMYQRKLNILTQGIINKDKSWSSNFEREQQILFGSLLEFTEDKNEELLNLLEEENLALKKNDQRSLLKLMRKEKKLILIKNRILLKEGRKLKSSLISGTKSYLSLLTYYSGAMSLLFTFFIFLINLNKKSIKKLEAERKKRDFMLDSLDCAVLLVDKNLELISYNEKASQIWGKNNLTGNRLEELLPTTRWENELGEIDDANFSESPIFETIKSLKENVGATLHIGLHTQSTQLQWFQMDLKTFKGELFLISLINVTHLIEAKNLIKKQQRSLIEQSKMSALGQMSGGMAHEINNPLAIICSEAEELLEIAEEEGRVAKEEATSISLNIKKTSDRIAKIVRGLRVFSRQGNGDEFQECLMDTVFEEVVVMAQEKFKSQGVIFNVDRPNEIDLKYPVWGNEVQLIQVLVNLLNNAYDAVKTQKDRQINLKWSLMPDHHLIVIKDNGTGIDIKNIEKIFDPFFTTKKVGEGTGLGLSLSKSIMESHNGDLAIGELNEGAEFILKIPRLEKSQEKGKEDKWAS